MHLNQGKNFTITSTMCLLNGSYKYYNEETLTSVQEFQTRMSTLKERSCYEAFEIKLIMKVTDLHEKKLIMQRYNAY